MPCSSPRERGTVSPASEPEVQLTSHPTTATAHPPPPGSQIACYLPRLKASVAQRYVLTFPWTPEG